MKLSFKVIPILGLVAALSGTYSTVRARPISKEILMPIAQVNAEDFFNRATDEYRSGYRQGEPEPRKVVEATIADLTQAIRLNPNYIEAYFFRGSLRGSDLQDYKGAIEDFTQVIRIEPKRAEAYIRRAELRAKLGDRQGAKEDEAQAQRIQHDEAAREIQLINQELRAKPKDANLYEQRASARARFGDIQGAVADLTEVRRLKTAHPDNTYPDIAGTYTYQAIYHSNAGDKRGAIEDLTQAIRLKPDDGDLYSNRAAYRVEFGDYRGAIADLTQTIRLQPCVPSAYSSRASLRSKIGDKLGAIADYTQAIQFDNIDIITAWDYLGRGDIYFEQGNYQRAIADYTQAIRAYPKSVRAYSKRARARTLVGDRQGADEDRKIAASLPPTEIKSVQFAEFPMRCRVSPVRPSP